MTEEFKPTFEELTEYTLVLQHQLHVLVTSVKFLQKRLGPDGGYSIKRDDNVEMTVDEWMEFVVQMTAINAVTDWWDETND